MKYGRKALPVLGAKALDGENGIVEAYCSVFNNVDYAGEIIRPGFFADTIKAAQTSQLALPKVLWSHDMWELPLGFTKEAEEVLPYDGRLPAQISSLGGLRVVGQFTMNVQKAREAFESIKAGALDKYSIGYYVIESKYNAETGIYELLKGEWLEWSPVNFAANDETLTVDAKGRVSSGFETDEHLFLVHKAMDFVDGSFRREVKDHNGVAYTVVTGKSRTTGEQNVASLRFDADAWSAQEAKAFCTDMGRGNFVIATKDVGEGTERLADHGARVVAQLSAYVARLEDVKAKRVAEGKAGRVLSEANRNVLAGLIPDLQAVTERVQKLLDDTAEKIGDDGKSSSPVDDSVARKLLGQAFALQTELDAMDLEAAS
jgi:HK97 family phage prohead protease